MPTPIIIVALLCSPLSSLPRKHRATSSLGTRRSVKSSPATGRRSEHTAPSVSSIVSPSPHLIETAAAPRARLLPTSVNGLVVFSRVTLSCQPCNVRVVEVKATGPPPVQRQRAFVKTHGLIAVALCRRCSPSRREACANRRRARCHEEPKSAYSHFCYPPSLFALQASRNTSVSHSSISLGSASVGAFRNRG